MKNIAIFRWIREIALGVRLAIAGGRKGWTRIALIAMGVSLGVMALLAPASIPTLLQARDTRNAAREPIRISEPSSPGDNTILIATSDTVFHDRAIYGRTVMPEGPQAPVPPGISALPGPDQLIVPRLWLHCWPRQKANYYGHGCPTQ